ncbi:hypothetical protein OG407_02020 [Streptomyces sp. NBC_01515]
MRHPCTGLPERYSRRQAAAAPDAFDITDLRTQRFTSGRDAPSSTEAL